MTRLPRPLVRVAVLDSHSVFRFGVQALLMPEPDVAVVGAAADEGGLWPLLHRVDPDLLLLDHQPGWGHRLGLCLRVRARTRTRTVLCAAEPGERLELAAALAGASAVVGKADAATSLLHAVRAVGAGETALAPPAPRVQAAAAAGLSDEDRAVFAMRLAGTPAADIAAVTGLDPSAVAARVAAVAATVADTASDLRVAA